MGFGRFWKKITVIGLSTVIASSSVIASDSFAEEVLEPEVVFETAMEGSTEEDYVEEEYAEDDYVEDDSVEDGYAEDDFEEAEATEPETETETEDVETEIETSDDSVMFEEESEAELELEDASISSVEAAEESDLIYAAGLTETQQDETMSVSEEVAMAVDNNFKAYARISKTVKATVRAYPDDLTPLIVDISGNDLSKVTYKWRKKDGKWSNGSRIRNIKVVEDTVYECLVNDGFGTEITVTFNVKVDNDFSCSVIGDAEHTILEAESTYRIGVSVKAHDTNNVEYKWFKNGQETDKKTSYIDAKYGALYRIDVNDGYGNTASESFKIYKVKNMGAKVEKPDENVRVSNLTCAPKETIKLSPVNVNGFTCSWKEVAYSEGGYDGAGDDGNYTRTGSVYRFTGKKNTSVICRITDGKYHIQYLKYNILIDNKLALAAVSNEVHAKPGKAATLATKTSCADKNGLKYTWRVYNPEKNRYERIDETTGNYKISKAEKSQSYVCIVTDAYGNEASVDIDLIVDNEMTATPETTELCPHKTTFKVKMTGDTDGAQYNWTIDGNTTSTDVPEIEFVPKSKTVDLSVTDKYGNTKTFHFDIIIKTAKWSAWTVKTKATVYKNGTKTRTCAHCDYVESAVIKKLAPTIKFSSDSIILEKGKQKKVTAKMANSDRIEKVVVSKKVIATATFDGKNNPGSVTITGKAVGTTSVAVKTKAGKVKKFTVKVIAPASAPKLSKTNGTVAKNSTISFTATPSKGDKITKVTCSNAVASASLKGNVVTVKGLKVGTCKVNVVTATGKSSVFKVTVK